MPAANRQVPLRHRRLGLYGPFILLLAAVIAWSLGWLWMRREVTRNLNAWRATMAEAGYQVSWRTQSMWGYPFRLDLSLSDFALRSPSGWRLSVPTANAEAELLTPGHWVADIPGDVTLTNRAGQPLLIRTKVLRASLSDIGAHPPRLSVEAIDVALSGPAGANPFFFSSAGEVHLHTRAGPDDQGAFYLEIDQANAPFTGLLGRIADGKPVTLIADSIYSHAAAVDGPDWASCVARWRDQNGVLNMRALKLLAGDAVLDAKPGALTVDRDGRLQGSLSVTLRAAPRALAVMTRSGAIRPETAATAASVLDASRQGAVDAVTIDFQAGQTTLGPAAIGPSPKVY
jgi:hypothetical protein